MRTGIIWLWCCTIFLNICFGSAVAGAISKDGNRTIEQLRLKHYRQDVVSKRLGLIDLADQMRKKHEKNSLAEEPEAAEKQIPSVPAALAASSITSPAVLLELVASEAPDAVKVLAEKYDHMPDDAKIPPANVLTRTDTTQMATKSPDDKTFGGFLAGAVISIFLMFFGALLMSLDKVNPPGACSFIGLPMLGFGFIMTISTAAKFWPLVLLLALGAMLGGSKGSSSGCGCGCMPILVILVLWLVLF